MTTTEPELSDLIADARANFFDSLPTHFERVRWNSDQLTACQTDRLRALLRAAVAGSPFHRDRLRGIDPSGFELSDLPSLPTMTKAEMMAAYEDVVTDRQLTLETVDAHLDSLAQAPSVLFDRYVVLATGGTSGVRGVFASDVSGAAQQMAAVIRSGLAQMTQAVGWPPPGPAPMAIVAAPSCIHATRGLSSLFMPGRLATVTFAPVTLPFPDILERLQQAQPLILVGYPSVIARVADARARGELDISPMVVSVTSEQLTTDHVDRINTGLGVPPTNSYGTSEGLMGTAPPGTDVFDFASDLAIIEFVDADDRPVSTGQAADHVLVTNLFNTTQPLIRYRIDDAMTPAPPSPDHGHQRATLRGRNDEELRLGDVTVHPLTIRSVMAADANVSEFQIQRGDDGEIRIDVAGTGIDVADVERRVRTALRSSGAPDTAVVVTAVERIPRDPRTGKARQFVTT